MAAPSPLSVLLADPHARLRAAIATLLANEDGIAVVGSVGTARDAAALMRRHRPDVLVADLALTAVAGRLLGSWGPVDASVPLIVTGFEAPASIEPVLRARGAAAYVAKDRLFERLPAVVRHVARAPAGQALPAVRELP